MKNNEMISIIRKSIPSEIAKSICDVQPIPSDAIKKIYENSMSEQELIDNDYEPVEKNGFSLMWIKKDSKNESE